MKREITREINKINAEILLLERRKDKLLEDNLEKPIRATAKAIRYKTYRRSTGGSIRRRKFRNIEPIETETIPVDVEFKRKDGSSFKVKAKKVVRKRVASKKALSAYFPNNKSEAEE